MKRLVKYAILSMIAVATLSSCSDDDKLPVDTESELGFGAILREIDASLSTDLFNLGTSEYNITVEYDDELGGTQLSDVNVYVSFVDNTPDSGDNSADEVLLRNIPASSFTADPTTGKPRTTINVQVTEAMSALGLVSDDLDGSDQFIVRLEVNTTDGRTFTDVNTGANVSATGGGASFFRSPFSYNSSVVCLFDAPDFFTGAYTMTETTGNTDPFGGNYGPQYFNSPASHAIVMTADGTERSFEVNMYPLSFSFPQTFTLNLVCGKVFLFSTASSGSLSCGGTTIQDIQDDASPAFFDLGLVDDASLDVPTLGFGSSDGGCGVGSYQINLRFDRQ